MTKKLSKVSKDLWIDLSAIVSVKEIPSRKDAMSEVEIGLTDGSKHYISFSSGWTLDRFISELASRQKGVL